MKTETDPRPSVSAPAIRAAIVDFEDARRRFLVHFAALDAALAAGVALDDLDDDEGPHHRRLEDARAHLVRVLLARSGDLDATGAGSPESRVHRTTGVFAGGRFYLAAVEGGYAELPVGHDPMNAGRPVMNLVFGDRADIADLDGPG